MNVLVVTKSDRLAMDVIRCLKISGKRAHLMSAENPMGVRYSRFCSGWCAAAPDLFKPPYTGAAAQILDCCQRRGIDLVMGLDMPAVFMLSTVKPELAAVKVFPLAGPETLQMLDNKWSFARFLREHQLPTPETSLVESVEQLAAVKWEFPLMVKPPQLEDGIGVRKLNSLDEALAHLRENSPARQLPLLLQEYIPGADIDLSILADHGKVVDWTVQQWRRDGALEFIDDDYIAELGRRIAMAVRFHGVAHFDMRRDERDGSVKILECNPRFWATLRMSVWNGTDFVDRGIRLGEGERLSEARLNRRIAYMFPWRALAPCVKGRFGGLGRLTSESWRDAWQTISDPLTLAYKMKNRAGNRRCADDFSAGSETWVE